MGDFWIKLGTALLGSLATAFFTRGSEALFGAKQPRQRDVYQDVQMQREAAEPIRTPEQTQADQMAVAASQQRAQTFTALSKEYEALKTRGPIWDPYEETRLREEAMGEAAARGMAESGQAQEHVRRRLEESRIRRAGLHETALSNLRSQMTPYATVQAPSQPPIFTPQIAPQPRQVQPTFTAAPFDIGAALMPDRPERFTEEEWKKRQAKQTAGTFHPT